MVCPLCRVMIGRNNYCRECAFEHAPRFPFNAPFPFAQRTLPFPEATWGVREVITIFLISIAVVTVFNIFLTTALGTLVSDTAAAILSVFIGSLLLYSLLLGGTYYSVKILHGKDRHSLGLTFEGGGKGLAWGFGIGLPLFVGAIFLAFLSEKVFPTYEDSVSKSMLEVSKGGVSPLLIFLFVFTLIVMAPICEEIFFRGYFYPVLRNRMSAQAAMLLNGFIFSAVHLSLAGFLPRFLLGCGLSYIYDKKRNLLGPIAAHSLYNGLILLLSGILHLF